MNTSYFFSLALSAVLCVSTAAHSQTNAARPNEDDPNVVRMMTLVKAASVKGDLLGTLDALESGKTSVSNVEQWRSLLGEAGELVGRLCQTQALEFTADSVNRATPCYQSANRYAQLLEDTLQRYPERAHQFYLALLVARGWSGDGAAYEQSGRAALERINQRMQAKDAFADDDTTVLERLDEAHSAAAMVLAVNIWHNSGSGDQSPRTRTLRVTSLALYFNALMPTPNWKLNGWSKHVPDVVAFLEDQLPNPKHGEIERLILCNAYIRLSQWRNDQGQQAAKAKPHLAILQNSVNPLVRTATLAMLAKI